MQLASTPFGLTSADGHLQSRRILVAVGWVLLFLLLVLALWSRRPDALFRPQFIAEDGTIFYQQAHELGFLHSLLIPDGGYLHLVPRLVAGLAQLLPLAFAPFLFNLVAMAVQVAPATFLLSPRAENLGPIGVRILFALFDLGIPSLEELHVNLTGLHFHLAVLTFLIFIARPPKSFAGKTFDIGVLVCSAFTGPICIILVPVSLWVFYRRRESWTLRLLLILAVGAAAQMFSLTVLSARPRSSMGLGASLPSFFRIMAGQVFLPLFAGVSNLYYSLHGTTQSVIVGCVVTILGCSLLLFVFNKGTVEIQALILFAGLMLATSLALPLASLTTKQWPVLEVPGSCTRYWYVPHLALMAAIVWALANTRRAAVRVLWGISLALIIAAVARGWQYQALPDLQFHQYVQIFDELPAGQSLTIPIYPPGWFFEITQKKVRGPETNASLHHTDTIRTRFGISSTSQISSLLTGHIDSVNQAPILELNNPLKPIHIRPKQGVELSGWVVSAPDSTATSIDEVYAVRDDSLFRCAHVARPDVVENLRTPNVKESGYFVYLPASAFHPGLQGIQLLGYERASKKLYRFPDTVYIYLDSDHAPTHRPSS